MKKDPLDIVISLIFNLNLLRENEELNINKLKSLPKINRSWVTIKKYLKIIQLIQKYCPKITLEDSKFKIKKSEIYRRFSDKQKLILYLFNNQALNEGKAIEIPNYLKNETIRDSIGYLFHKNEEEKYYLSKVGLDDFKSINEDLTELIYREKKINDIFSDKEGMTELSETASEGYGKRSILELQSDTHEGEKLMKSDMTFSDSASTLKIPLKGG